MTVRLTRPQASEIARIKTQGAKGIPMKEGNKSTRALERAGYVVLQQLPGSDVRRYVLTDKARLF